MVPSLLTFFSHLGVLGETSTQIANLNSGLVEFAIESLPPEVLADTSTYALILSGFILGIVIFRRKLGKKDKST